MGDMPMVGPASEKTRGRPRREATSECSLAGLGQDPKLKYSRLCMIDGVWERLTNALWPGGETLRDG